MPTTLTDPASITKATVMLNGNAYGTYNLKGDRFDLIVDLGPDSGVDLTDDSEHRLVTLHEAFPQSEHQTLAFVEGAPTQVRWTIIAPFDRSSLPPSTRLGHAQRIATLMGSSAVPTITIQSYTPAEKESA